MPDSTNGGVATDKGVQGAVWTMEMHCWHEEGKTEGVQQFGSDLPTEEAGQQ